MTSSPSFYSSPAEVEFILSFLDIAGGVNPDKYNSRRGINLSVPQLGSACAAAGVYKATRSLFKPLKLKSFCCCFFLAYRQLNGSPLKELAPGGR